MTLDMFIVKLTSDLPTASEWPKRAATVLKTTWARCRYFPNPSDNPLQAAAMADRS
jgi:hypothetical protein